MPKPTPKIPIPQAAAACTAFAAFSVSIVVGIGADNPADTVLMRALIAMAIGFGGGFLVGLVCDWIVHQEIARIEQGIDEDRAASDASAGAEVDADGLTGVDIIEEEPEAVATDARQ